MPHELELRYGLTANELLDALNNRFRARVTLEGAVAEVQMAKHVKALEIAGIVSKFRQLDQDGQPDFLIWLKDRPEPIRAECKNVRDSDEAFRLKGEIIGYKVETQKTRASKEDHTSRMYSPNQFEILGVCLGKKTHNWTDFLYINVRDLKLHKEYPNKLATIQRVPLPGALELAPWSKNLGDVLNSL